MTVILLGVFWGFMEATLGGVLHLFNLPMTGELLGSIGFGIMYLGFRRGLRPAVLIAIPVIAAAMKFLDVLLFNLPLLHVTVVWPAAAILIQGGAFAAVSPFLRRVNWAEAMVFTAPLAIISVAGFAALFGVDMTVATLILKVFVMSVLTAFLFGAAAFFDASVPAPFLAAKTAAASAAALLALAVSANVLLH